MGKYLLLFSLVHYSWSFNSYLWMSTTEHSPLSANKSFFQFWSQMSISHPQRPKPYLPHCSEAPGYLKFMCEVLNFKKNLDVASKRFLFYTIKCTPKLRYNESWYSEFREIVNKCQLPLLLTKSRYSEFRDIVNKRSLTRSFVISKFGCICQSNKIFREINSHSKFHIIVYLYYISGKIAFVDEVDHCTECHTCYEYQSKQCGKCGSSWAQFCPKCNNTSRTMCEICGLDVSSWDSWTHSIEDCSVHSISQLDIQVKILHLFFHENAGKFDSYNK